jgi:prepilin-type N-terminal cleavage/methylation domain-containing protein/prepilin-type processing-associated H-X9-DG protein
MRDRSARLEAFTLIELLVVISIIALLIGILLPVLGSAREAARAAVCLGHMRGVGQGMAVYTTDYRQWLPGPNTSGWDLTQNEPYGGGESSPTSNFDWVSPILGESLALPTPRVDKIEALFNEDFRCPSNQERFQSQFSGPSTTLDPDQLFVPSYVANRWFLFHSINNLPSGGIYQFTGDINVPDDYAPSIDVVGQASNKVFAMDGTAYVRWSGTTVTDVNFDTRERFTTVGDSWMSNGPALSYYNGTSFKRDGNGDLVEGSRRYAFRHSDNINAVYFDGHAQALSNDASKDPRLHWPEDSEVARTSRLDDPSGLIVGDLIP